jgi:predicted PurR-regulated permease PerM
MDFRSHLRTTGSALGNWLLAQAMDAAAVGALWLLGLLVIGYAWYWAIPLALFAGLLQFIPNVGTIIGLLPPLALSVFAPGGELWFGWLPPRMVYVLILYAVIVLVDALIFQPYFMKRTTKVPIWASILTPIVLGILIPFWGVVIAAPLLAVIYAYRAKRNAKPAEVIPFPNDRRAG